MLGFFTAEGPGVADQLLIDVASHLQSQSARVAGVVQCNLDQPSQPRCDMVLRLLGTGQEICISQRLGPGSMGCRLDPVGLEQAVGIVEASLHNPTDLLIVNKFGKQEAGGRGFRPLIGQALSTGIPVLVSVNIGYLDDFRSFSSEIGQTLSPKKSTILKWCFDAMGSATS